MRIVESRSRLTASESPIVIWALGLGFVASGLFVLTMPLWLDEWTAIRGWIQLAIVVIGISHIGGGLYTIVNARATRIELDTVKDQGTVRMRGFWERRGTLSTFHPSQAQFIELAESRDSDGDPIYRLRLWLAGGEHVWLQAQATHGAAYLMSRAERIARFLHIERPRLGPDDGNTPQPIGDGRSRRSRLRRAS
jgi:hypothetical protein